MSDDRESDLISAALDPLVVAWRTDLLDALYCEFHNAAGTLEGNTEASDIEWFARRIWEAEDDRRIGWHWESVIDESERERYRRLARVCLREAVGLMSRMANRLRLQSKAIQTILKAERLAEGKGAGRG